MNPRTEDEVNEFFDKKEAKEIAIYRIMQLEPRKIEIALNKLYHRIEDVEKENVALKKSLADAQGKADTAWTMMREMESNNARLIDKNAQIKAQNRENSQN